MKLTGTSTIILLVILLILVAAVAVVTATNAMRVELSAADYAIAAVDIEGAQALHDGEVAFTNHRPISPWVIDPGGRSLMR
jgi:hypothetical protein